MFSIADLLERAKAKANIESDYRLAKVIGKSHQVISNYRVGKSLPEESVIEQLCALSGDDVGVIAAQIQAERSKTPEAKNMWLMVAARLRGAVQPAILAALFAIGLIAAPADNARASGLDVQKQSNATVYTSYEVAILAVQCFLLVRLRRFQGFFRLAACMAF